MTQTSITARRERAVWKVVRFDSGVRTFTSSPLSSTGSPQDGTRGVFFFPLTLRWTLTNSFSCDLRWRAAMGSWMWGCITDFFTYETTKSVVVKSWSVGIINRIVQLLIITYFVGSVVQAWFLQLHHFWCSFFFLLISVHSSLISHVEALFP